MPFLTDQIHIKIIEKKGYLILNCAENSYPSQNQSVLMCTRKLMRFYIDF